MSADSETLGLDRLEPPRGGLHRLVARRDELPLRVTWLAVASGIAVATLALLLVESNDAAAPPLPLPPNGARLVDTSAVDAPLRVNAARVQSLPSASPEVQLYWLDAEP